MSHKWAELTYGKWIKIKISLTIEIANDFKTLT